MNIHEAVEEFRRRRPLYEEFTAKLRALLEELCKSEGLHVAVECRAKTVRSFEEKIQRPARLGLASVLEARERYGRERFQAP